MLEGRSDNKKLDKTESQDLTPKGGEGFSKEPQINPQKIKTQRRGDKSIWE